MGAFTASPNNNPSETVFPPFEVSFITDETGALLADADKESEGFWVAEFDFAACRDVRAGWGFFRDRRPQNYGALLTHDGVNRVAGT